MKGIIAIALAALASTAHADAWVTDNMSGGKIVLSSFKCELQGAQPDERSALSWDSHGNTLAGCWQIISSDYVGVRWQGGEVKVFDMSLFKPFK